MESQSPEANHHKLAAALDSISDQDQAVLDAYISASQNNHATAIKVEVKAPTMPSVECEVEVEVKLPKIRLMEVDVKLPKMPSVECEVEVEVKAPTMPSVECEVEVEVKAPTMP